MSSSEIKVIVKSPAQKTDDQTIICNLDWTVAKLKNYICENFPFKPAVDDQRLIYSGHLLKDDKTLKEIFQPTEQDNSTFIVHLVFSLKNHNSTESKDDKKNEQQKQSSNTSTSNTDNDNNSTTSTTNLSSNQIPTISPISFNLTNDPSIDFANLYLQQMQQYQQMYVNYMTQFLNTSNNSLDSSSQQTTNMYNAMLNPIFFNPFLTVPNMNDFSPQQLNHSFNFINNSNNNGGHNSSADINNRNNETQFAVNNNNQQLNDQAANNIDQNDDIQNNGGGGFLDLINIFWNILILLSLLTASFTRTIFVFSIGILYYLYQTGFFSVLRIRLFGDNYRPTNVNNNRNNQPNTNNEEQLQQMMDENEMPADIRRRNTTNGQNNNQNRDVNNNNNEPVDENFVVSKFRFFWMVISSLFSSLMPHNGPIPVDNQIFNNH